LSRPGFSQDRGYRRFIQRLVLQQSLRQAAQLLPVFREQVCGPLVSLLYDPLDLLIDD
jgi:hypothetical protein